MIQRSSASVWGSIAVMVLAVTACQRATDTTNLTELQRVKSGVLDVVLLSPSAALRHGKDEFTIEFLAASDGHLVDVGQVRGSATMPMAGTPMFGSLDVQRTNVAGRYAAAAEISMAGTWRLPIEWDGPAGKGSVTFSAAVQ
jgi:hypothetical protein